MIVGKRRHFEDEPIQSQSLSQQYLRRITQDKQLESFAAAKKRIILSNANMIIEKYPDCNFMEICRLLEDFDNNLEMVIELIDQKQRIPQKIEINDQKQANQDEVKQQMSFELIEKLKSISTIEQAKQQIDLYFKAFEDYSSSILQQKINKCTQENKLLKSAFLKQNNRLQKNKEEFEQKEKQLAKHINDLKIENQMLKQTNNNLTVLLIQAQQQTSPSHIINDDVY